MSVYHGKLIDSTQRDNSSHSKVSISLLLAHNKTHNNKPGTNTYLIGRGHKRILIDTGEGKPTWAANLQTVLSEENATVHQALLTHWHGDHVSGLPDLLRICPQAQIFKNQPDSTQTDIQEGQVFSVEGATLTAFHTPGHTVDHMVFMLEEENAMITGDSKCGYIHTNSLKYLTQAYRRARPRHIRLRRSQNLPQ